MRHPIVLTILVLASLTSTEAQPHSSGMFLNGLNHLYFIDSIGGVTSVSYPGVHYAGTMNWDNKTALVFDATRSAIVQIDPSTLSIVSTFFKSNHLSNSTSVMDMTFDHNGDLFFTSSDPAGFGLGVFAVDRGGILRTVIHAATSLQPFGGARNVSIDIDSGELLIADSGTNGAKNDPVFLLHRDGSSYSTIGVGFNHRYSLRKHALTGDIYSGSCCGGIGGNALLVLKNGASVATVYAVGSSSGLQSAYALTMERTSAASQRILVGSFKHWSITQSGLWHVDIPGAGISKVTTLADSTYDVVPAYGRNLQTVESGKGIWDVLVSAPGHGGKSFIVLFGFSGVRPALKLPDGRRIPLVLDQLAHMSMAGVLTPYVTGNSGTLSAAGQAFPRVNLSMLGRNMNGIVVYLCAAVLDPNAPLGVALITDPAVLLVEGL